MMPATSAQVVSEISDNSEKLNNLSRIFATPAVFAYRVVRGCENTRP